MAHKGIRGKPWILQHGMVKVELIKGRDFFKIARKEAAFAENVLTVLVLAGLEKPLQLVVNAV